MQKLNYNQKALPSSNKNDSIQAESIPYQIDYHIHPIEYKTKVTFRDRIQTGIFRKDEIIILSLMTIFLSLLGLKLGGVLWIAYLRK